MTDQLMKIFRNSFPGISRRVSVVFALCAIVGTLMFATRLSSAETQNRPRRTAETTPTTTPSPTTQTPANRATVPPTQTPTPRDRKAPTLGDAPPIPKYKPKPTPTPTLEEIDEKSIIKIDSQLVTLNVPVIDRSNPPIHNVSK